jgi:hypothetical protein
MKLFLPVDHDAWNDVRKILLRIAETCSFNISCDFLRDTVSEIYCIFSGKPSPRKFEDISVMLAAVPVEVTNQFIQITFPQMCRDIVLFCDSRKATLETEVPTLSRYTSKRINFAPLDVYVLLSASFLCIPLVQEDGLTIMSEGSFHLFFTNRERIVNKLFCMLNYFNLIVASQLNLLPQHVSKAILDPTRNVEIERLVSEQAWGAERWANCDAALSAIEVRGDYARIESCRDSIQADFANKHIGGGVLRRGCVQEEIRFMVSPECLIAVLVCDELADNEAIMIRNTIQFNDYSGYSSSFKCLGLSKSILSLMTKGDSIPTDDILCIDAIQFGPEKGSQFGLTSILRELEKCRTGLTGKCGKPFATGNWGCGVFGGDTPLKAVIQWLAASVCSRDLIFFPFDDRHTSRLKYLSEKAISRKMKSGEMFRILLKGLLDCQLYEGSTIDYMLAAMELSFSSTH